MERPELKVSQDSLRPLMLSLLPSRMRLSLPLSPVRPSLSLFPRVAGCLKRSPGRCRGRAPMPEKDAALQRAIEFSKGHLVPTVDD